MKKYKKDSPRRPRRAQSPDRKGGVIHDPPIEHAEAPVQIPDVGGDRCYWPADETLPSSWTKLRARAVPCPACRRVLQDDGSQAAVCTRSDRDVAFFRCRCCGHRWQLPVQTIDD